VRQRGASIAPDRTVVAVAPDLGDRYLSSVYDDRWVIDRGLGEALERKTQMPQGAQDVFV
jgi:cysteine synthase A